MALPSSGVYLAGKQAYFLVNAASMSFDKWKLSAKAAPVKVTNFLSNGYQELVIGIYDGTITSSGPYNDGAMALTTGQAGTFHLGWTAGLELVCPGYITELVPSTDVNDAGRVDFTAMTSGTFTIAIV